jgi:hypothetical protein
MCRKILAWNSRFELLGRLPARNAPERAVERGDCMQKESRDM